MGDAPVGLKENIVDYLLAGARAHGHRPYLITPERTWSVAELDKLVSQAANYFKSIGVTPGQRILFSVIDDIDFPVIFLAAMKIGAVAIPINIFLKPQDYQYYITDSEASVVIVDHALAETILKLRAQLPCVKSLIVTRQRATDLPFFKNKSRASIQKCDVYPLDPDEMAFWLYSSGSTGDPKGVVHTGNHIYWATELFGSNMLKMTSDDVMLCPPKMYFAYGLGNQLYFPLRLGAQNITNPDPISIEIIWKQWLQHKPTILMAVPTLFAGLLRYAEQNIPAERVREASQRLRLCISGGEILPAAVMERWRKLIGVEIFDAVGTTEMTHMFAIKTFGKPVPGSCGQIVPGYRAEIVDDDDRPVAKGEVGNLRVFGPSAAREYWNQPEKTQSVMGKGGVLTGDKMREDADGNFYLVGRSDDMLRVGGVWVSPAEVESVIAQHDAVIECAVIGAPDGEGMIKPKAYVVLKNISEADSVRDALRDHVRSRLAHIKCPRWFEFIDELPKTSTGKIQRFRLRQQNEAGGQADVVTQ